ncbi:hypothetical protein BV372_02540 [Nostoc sp. T09]|uniref:hypothetical protein n=1 Tax=Nostoc sp. T09 TaxID=1932621 RepID=UPI000A3957D6|nr:hypothetical protein [Nostoc sp. T09]OUL37294.1 hypothetical protein BV372_02540 [Nostoc sp. T09]
MVYTNSQQSPTQKVAILNKLRVVARDTNPVSSLNQVLVLRESQLDEELTSYGLHGEIEDGKIQNLWLGESWGDINVTSLDAIAQTDLVVYHLSLEHWELLKDLAPRLFTPRCKQLEKLQGEAAINISKKNFENQLQVSPTCLLQTSALVTLLLIQVILSRFIHLKSLFTLNIFTVSFLIWNACRIALTAYFIFHLVSQYLQTQLGLVSQLCFSFSANPYIKLAEAHNLIATLVLGENSQVRPRYPRILILNEATSGLYGQSKQQFQQNLACIGQEVTTFIISNTLVSAIPTFILVLYRCIILGKSTYKKLLGMNSFEYHLYQLQFNM